MLQNALYKFLLIMVVFSLSSFSYAKTFDICDAFAGNWQGSWQERIIDVTHGVNATISINSGVVRMNCRLSNNVSVSYLGTCRNGELNVKTTSENPNYVGFRGKLLQQNQLKLIDFDRLIVVDLFKT